MRENPERLAWIILLTAFSVFCTLAIGIPRLGWWYVTESMVSLSSQLTSVRGTILAQNVQDEVPLPIVRGQQSDIEELTVITTDGASQGILVLFDNSVVTLYQDTILTVLQTRQPQFSFSNKPDVILMRVIRGRVRATIPTNGEQQFVIQTPHTRVEMQQGSYAVEVSAEQSLVTTRLGQAWVSAENETVQLQNGQLSVVLQDEPPSPPSAAEQNLLSNGTFVDGLNEAWDVFTYTPTDTVTPTLNISQLGGRPVLELKSFGEDQLHTEASIQQLVDKDVQDFESLQVSLDVRLDYQSLAGGGSLGSEFPLRLHLTYKDAQGNDRSWYHGFYYIPPAENFIIYDQVDNSYEQIARSVWYPYESENLLALLDGPAKPVYIRSLQIYASGWIYDVKVADVKLLAKE